VLKTARTQRKSTARLHVWAPSGCPVRIKYSPEVLRQAAQLKNGFLYGMEERGGFRVTEARGERRDDERALGTFSTRERGEVFMTESDLARMESCGGSIALVVAATNAGFFVHESDGQIQTIKSYQEFPVPQKNSPSPSERAHAPARGWVRPALLGSLAFASMLLPVRGAQPLALMVREDSGQLKITWNTARFDDARLEIRDGAERNWIPVPRGLSSATYVPATSDVRIRLIDNGRVKEARFILISREEAEIAELHAQAESLRASLEEGHRRAATLKRKLATLK